MNMKLLAFVTPPYIYQIQTNGPINARFASFVLEMLFCEFCPIVFSHHSIRILISLLLIACPIRAYVDST